MKFFKPFFTCFLFWALGSSLLFASPQKTIRMRVGAIAGKQSPWAKWLQEFGGRTKRDSNNILSPQYYFGASLGSELQMLRSTKSGDLDVFLGTPADLAAIIVPELNVLELPFLFGDNEEADYILGSIHSSITKLLARRDLVFLMWSTAGWQGLGSRSNLPLDDLNALKGKRLRSLASSVQLETLRALGASAVQVPAPDLPTALSTGMIDGFSAPMIATVAFGWFKKIKSYTLLNHIYQPLMLVASKKWFDRLPIEIQRVVLNRQEEQPGILAVRKLTQPLINNMKLAGVTVLEPTPAQRDAIKQKVMPVWKKTLQKFPSSKPLLDEILALKSKRAAMS